MRRKLIIVGAMALVLTGCAPTAASPSAAPADTASAAPASAGNPSAAGPSSTPLGSPPPGPSAATPSLAPGETYAFVLAGSRSIPAGEKVTTHLNFESTSVALVGLSAASGSLSARVGSTVLTEKVLGNGFSTWEAALEAPVDADLVISNLSTSAVVVDALVSLATKRVLTVTAPATSTAGVAVPIEVTLTEPARGETPTAFLVDESDTRTPIELSAVGPGRWTGTVTLPHGGSYRVLATVTGDRPRSGVGFLVTASGTDHIGATFEESLIGNGDGRADALRLTVPVTTTGEGTLELSGDLVDSSGAFVARAFGRTTLQTPGSASIDLDFDGEDIYNSGHSGRYRLTDVKLWRPDQGLQIEDQKADMGLTAESYNAAAFEDLTR